MGNPIDIDTLDRDGLLKLHADVFARLIALSAPQGEPSRPETPPANDRTLYAAEIARELGVRPRWVFQNMDRLPFARRVSRKSIVCLESDLRRWLQRRKG